MNDRAPDSMLGRSSDDLLQWATIMLRQHGFAPVGISEAVVPPIAIRPTEPPWSDAVEGLLSTLRRSMDG